MVLQRASMALIAGLLLMTCLTCRAEQTTDTTSLAQTLSEQSFLDSQWIYLKGVDVKVGFPSKRYRALSYSSKSQPTARKSLNFDAFRVNKGLLNIAAGVVGLSVGLGHVHMEQDQARFLNLATLSLGMSSMMRGMRALSRKNQELVSIKGLGDIGRTPLSSRGIKVTVRPAISLNSSVGLEFRAKF